MFQDRHTLKFLIDADMMMKNLLNGIHGISNKKSDQRNQAVSGYLRAVWLHLVLSDAFSDGCVCRKLCSENAFFASLDQLVNPDASL